MQIVLGIDRHPFSGGGFQIGVPRFEVGPHRIAPAADPVPRVRGHVIDMARAGHRRAEKLGACGGTFGDGGGFGGVDVQVTRARVMDVARQDALEHLVKAADVWAVHVACAAPWFEQEECVGIERRDVEVIRIPCRNLLHRIAIRAILFAAFRGIELLDVAHGDRVDERTLLLAGLVFQCHRLARGGVRVRRLLVAHRRVQVRSPRPRFSPVADRAVGITLPRLAERTDGLGLGERVHHLEALVEVRLGLLALRRDRPAERPQPGLVDGNRFSVAIVERASRRRLRPEGNRRDGAERDERSRKQRSVHRATAYSTERGRRRNALINAGKPGRRTWIVRPGRCA